ncbi:hypothetical protein [Flavobacterium sp.]|uniref:hypothetical protein n=1 Tax=Flavobacterium sp. TaxID=239 RepID=UPI003D6B2F6B
MNREELKLVSQLALVIVGFYIAHKIIFLLSGFNTINFEYSLQQLYLFFAGFSIAIIILLLKIKQKNLDIVGNTFLLVTSVKMVACYILGRPILNMTQENALEKWNFFGLFVLFLVLETIFTIVILNKKEH